MDWRFLPTKVPLYFSDTVERWIYAYDWRGSDGALSHSRILTRIDRSVGLPDGLAVDAESFIRCVHWFGGCVTRYDREGKQERRIEMPAAQTSSLYFGGPDLDEIYLSSAARSPAQDFAAYDRFILQRRGAEGGLLQERIAAARRRFESVTPEFIQGLERMLIAGLFVL